MEATLTTYRDLERWADAFAHPDPNKKPMRLVICIGSPGHSKSETISRAMGSSALEIKGNLTPFYFYKTLYYNRDRDIIIDDVESIFKDRLMIRILKSLCETKEVRNISWMSSVASLDKEDIPHTFTTTSRVFIIANREKASGEHWNSLTDRGFLLHFRPSNQEVFEKAKTFFFDKEILDFIEIHLPYIDELSLRTFEHALTLRNAGLDWKKPVLETLKIYYLMVYRTLANDQSYKTDIERFSQFHKMTGLSRPMWYAAKDKIEEIEGKVSPPKYNRMTPRSSKPRFGELLTA